MLRITHTRGRRARAIDTLGSPRARIGSAPGSEVSFAANEAAPQHAEIRSDGRAYHLVDLGTRAGVFVNQRRVQSHALRSGDVVELGGRSGPAFRVDIVGPVAPPPGMPDAEGRIDMESAQRIVAEAVVRETSQREQAAAHLVRSKVLAASNRATKRNGLLAVGVVLTLGATLVTAGLVWRSGRRSSALADDVGLDRSPGSKVNGAVPTQVFTGREIYDRNKASLYVIGYTIGNRVGGVCSAVAIGSQKLATNAHCVKAFRDKGGTPIVTQNESGGRMRFTIVGAQMHPDYKHGTGSADSPDVALLRVDGKMPTYATIANDAEIRALGPGDDIYVLGFPGRVMDPISPSATFLQGHVGRVTGMREETTTADKSFLLQHDAVTRGGNSGSPVFNQYGHVIAIHAAHLDDEEEVKVNGQKTTRVSSSPYRVAMRVDLLRGVPEP